MTSGPELAVDPTVPATGGGSIVVGVDPSAGGRIALQWAIAEAIVRDEPLTALCAAGQPVVVSSMGWGSTVVDTNELMLSARRQLDDAVDSVLAEVPGPRPPIKRLATIGGAAEALVEQSETADLTVVGTHRLRGPHRWLGSVSDQVASHACGTVAIVPDPGGASFRPGAPIVVGVDGSANSATALRWAVAEGRRRRVPVRAVGVWSGSDPLDAAGSDRDGSPRSVLRSFVASVLGDGPAAAVEVEPVHDQPAGGLLAAADRLGSPLIVVGSRGGGGFVGLVVGSVARRVMHSTRRPLVVVRTAPPPAR